MAFLDVRDWATGATDSATVAMQLNVREIYDRHHRRFPSTQQFGQLLLLVLAFIGVLFLIIQFVALVIGFVLARQITGAVHDLFTGTEHLRNRDFTLSDSGPRARSAGRARRVVQRDDRRGHEAAQRERREGAHGAGDAGGARDPAEAAAVGSAERARARRRWRSANRRARSPATTTTSCTISDTKLGVLIADVSGKGLPAGLYMAQLKVLVQSLARTHPSPREFLKAVNRVVADNIDSKSFITMSYGVIDLETRRDGLRARRTLPADSRARQRRRPGCGKPS